MTTYAGGTKTYQEARDALYAIVREIEVVDINLARLRGCIEAEEATRAVLLAQYVVANDEVNRLEQEDLEAETAELARREHERAHPEGATNR